jgi:DNA-binding LacI/PurR family transcriptional regulator
MRLLRDSDVDAVAAMGDELALGVLRAVRRLGLDVPAGVAVTGWDDSAAAGAAGLTTVAQSLREQGELCARSVLEPGAGAIRISPPWQLVARESTRSAVRD